MTTTPELPVQATPALELSGLEIVYQVRGIDRPVVRDVSLQIAAGESYGLVGESGCGKTTIAFAAMHYLPRNGRVTAGSVVLDGEDVTAMDRAQLRRLRTSKAAMVYQNPGAALNPTIRVGDQVAERYVISGEEKATAAERTEAMLAKVQISDPLRVMHRYPHQLSGGMQQRVVIAMALATNPRLLILDEPTTGLDATVEAEVLELVTILRAEYGTSTLFISHNLGVIRRMCDRVGVLYAGRLVEEAPTVAVFDEPQHPYTVGLLRAIPRAGRSKHQTRLDTIAGFPPALGAALRGCVFAERCLIATDECRTSQPELHLAGSGHRAACFHSDRAQTLPRASAPSPPDSQGYAIAEGSVALEARHVSKTFRQEGQEVRALDDVSLQVTTGQTLGLVGESGSGKTTLAKVLLGLTAPDDGSVVELAGKVLAPEVHRRDDNQVRNLQIVFQNPDQALNRRWPARRIISRAVQRLTGKRGAARDAEVLKLAEQMRFDQRLLSARPAQLSGGLKQRVAIARAFVGPPRVVVCDEPTSALDVSVQAAILNLLADLQARDHTTYVFISHDLGVVRFIADHIAVLYLGQVMEVGAADDVFSGPHHPYTEALLSAVSTVDQESPSDRVRLEGEIPSAAAPPAGCVFHTRCPRRIGEVCDTERPPLLEVASGHSMACHIPYDELAAAQRKSSAERP